MPVILDPDSYDLWLDSGMRDVKAAAEAVEAVRRSADALLPVSTRIDHVANDDEGCSTPVELIQTQARLFW